MSFVWPPLFGFFLLISDYLLWLQNPIPMQGKLEWESDSGRQLTITDIPINKLSKVEIESLQRGAVTALQALDIPVSHGIVKGKFYIHMNPYTGTLPLEPSPPHTWS